jgi:integrase
MIAVVRGHGVDTKQAPISLAIVRRLEPPARGNRILYDSEIPGFGVRITAAGAIAFTLTYWIHNRQRRYTIGRYPEYTPAQARDEAIELRKAIREGKDPLVERVLFRTTPLVSDLAAQYITEHCEPEKKNRPKTLKDKRQMIKAVILPNLGRVPVSAVTADDIRRIHNLLKATPYYANRVRACLSSMFSYAVAKKIRADNPITKDSAPKYTEERRERWFEEPELERLETALRAHPNQVAANAIRMLLLTGARKGEVIRATWPQFNLARGVWTKPSAHTKQKHTEHVPLSRQCIRLLNEIRKNAQGEFLFPGRKAGQPIEDLKGVWGEIRKTAKLEEARLHDLRHTYASHLVSSGVPLAHVGKLLGHTQSQTTERNAHFADTPLREATNRFGKIVQRAGRPRRGTC